MDEELSSSSRGSKRCFTRLQHRRIWSPISLVRLCPSMDLIAYQLMLPVVSPPKQHLQATSPNSNSGGPPVSTSSQLCIHRTLNWQSIATVSSSSSSSSSSLPPSTTQGAALSSPAEAVFPTQLQAHLVEWCHDGRYVAVATGKDVALYCLETLLSTTISTTTATTTPDLKQSDDGTGRSTTGRIHTCALDPNSIVTSLSWAHVGTEHTSWPDDMKSDETYWIASKRSDRIYYVLPPSEYHDAGCRHTNGQNHSDALDETGKPTQHTPLSLLCVSSTSGLHLFLHGRYAIAYNLPMTSPYHGNIVVTSDLTHLICLTSLSSISLLSIASLSKNRYELQHISALYCSITQHAESICSSLPEVTASWKSSLKGLDLKLDGLLKLLDNYGLLVNDMDDPSDDVDAEVQAERASIRMKQGKRTMCTLLVQYILSGHTRSAPNLSNAMDQFFTSVQMNDQLVQRMERSLSGAVANVETSVRRQLVAPATALVYEIDQLYGLAAYRSDIIPTATALQFLQTSQSLLLLIDSALAALVQARSRLRDFCAWLRSLGAQIKARGTAANSVQRENAKKRRAPATIVHNLLAYLQLVSVAETDSYKGTTETVLGLTFLDHFNESSIVSGVDASRPISPSSVHPLSANMESTRVSTLSIPNTLRILTFLSDQVFAHPRSFLTQSIQRSNIQLPNATSTHGKVAITTRLGQGGIDLDRVTYGKEIPTGFFSPNMSWRSESTYLKECSNSMDHRQWLLVAQAINTYALEVHAIPLTWTKSGSDDFEDEETDLGVVADVIWTVRLTIPSKYTIRDIAFYGDDGKSSLSSSLDSGSGQEGRQQLGLLVSRQSSSNGVEAPAELLGASVELWLFPYDDLEFAAGSLQREMKSENSVIVRCQESNTTINYAVHPIRDVDSVDSVATRSNRTLLARTREVFSAVDFTNDPDQPCRLVVSGSRGIGAVIGKQQGGSVLEVLDLEEDEEEEDAMEADDDV